MIYDMQCNKCGETSTISCHISEHETKVKPGWPHGCGGRMTQVITGLGLGFVREGFPKNDPGWEHVTDDGRPISSKSQLKDLCEQNGSQSRYLMDDC